MIGKISVPRGEHVAPLIWYLFGPGRREEHTDPHLWPDGGIPPNWNHRCGRMGNGISGG